LQNYPKGSLGRAFYDFYAQFDWPLPGDPLWISEDLTVRHDLVHILCEYDISVSGEFRVSGFTAGNSTKFNWMIAMLGFTPPYVSTGQQFQPTDFTDAYHRGNNAANSFVDTWDFWPELEHPVLELRATYQI
jgi:ubiquinone biosynthesis protein Coq4